MNLASVRVRYLAAFALTLVLLVLIFSRMLAFDLRKDEQLFVSPALLLESGDLYRDFFYNHAPVSAWWFYLVNKAFGGTQITFSARFGVFLFWIALAAGLHFFAYRFTKSISTLAFVTVWLLVNPLLLNQTAVTGSNNFIPLVFAFFGIGFFLMNIWENQPRLWSATLSGLMLSLAAGTKVNAFVFIPILAIASLLVPTHLKIADRLKGFTLPFAIGGIVGAIPVLIYLVRDPAKFLAHVVQFHTGPHVDYWASRVASAADEQVAIGLRGKLELATELWFTHINLIALFIIILMIVLRLLSRERWSAFANLSASHVVCLVTLTAAVFVAFVPTPGFPQYYAVPIACVPFIVLIMFANLNDEQKASARPALLAGMVLGLLIGLPRLVQHAPELLSPKKWEVSRVHEFGTRLAQQINERGLKGPVATLVPVYALEGGLAVYPELATGQFAYRNAPFLSPELKQQFIATGPETVEALLSSNLPAAILVGFESELEKPFVEFAVKHGYVEVNDLSFSSRYGVAVVYLRPGS